MSSSNTNTKNKKSKRNIELSAEELALFCDQVFLILEAGIPLYDGFETLAKEAEMTMQGKYLKVLVKAC